MQVLVPINAISRLAATGAAVLVMLVPVSARAQSFVARDRSVSAAAESAALSAAAPAAAGVSSYRPVVGEKAIYDVEVKGRGVGTGSLEIVGRETVDGHQTLHAALRLSAGLLFAKANEQMDTWFDPDRLFSRHFSQNQRELGRTRQKNYLISPETRSFRETNGTTVDSLSTDEPLDDISMLYYARTRSLHVGDVDTIPRYFKPGHDVVIRVVRRETVTVPAGRFNTIVVQPTITNAGGLFGQGGKAEVYLTDDPERNVVMIKGSVPLIGSISLTLRELVARL